MLRWTGGSRALGDAKLNHRKAREEFGSTLHGQTAAAAPTLSKRRRTAPESRNPRAVGITSLHRADMQQRDLQQPPAGGEGIAAQADPNRRNERPVPRRRRRDRATEGQSTDIGGIALLQSYARREEALQQQEEARDGPWLTTGIETGGGEGGGGGMLPPFPIDGSSAATPDCFTAGERAAQEAHPLPPRRNHPHDPPPSGTAITGPFLSSALHNALADIYGRTNQPPDAEAINEGWFYSSPAGVHQHPPTSGGFNPIAAAVQFPLDDMPRGVWRGAYGPASDDCWIDECGIHSVGVPPLWPAGECPSLSSVVLPYDPNRVDPHMVTNPRSLVPDAQWVPPPPPYHPPPPYGAALFCEGEDSCWGDAAAVATAARQPLTFTPNDYRDPNAGAMSSYSSSRQHYTGMPPRYQPTSSGWG